MLQHIRPLLFASLALTQLSAVAQAEDDQRGQFAMNVFHSICLLGKGDMTLPSQYPEYRLRELVPQAQTQFLAGRTGRVWAAQVPFGNFVVLITEGRECSVYVRRIAPRVSTAQFEFTLKTFAKKGTLEEKTVASASLAQGQMSTRSFSLVGEFNSLPYVAVVSTSESEIAPLQAIFTARTTQ